MDTMFFLPSEMWKGCRVLSRTIEEYVEAIMERPHNISTYPFIKIRIHQMHLKYEQSDL